MTHDAVPEQKLGSSVRTTSNVRGRFRTSRTPCTLLGRCGIFAGTTIYRSCWRCQERARSSGRTTSSRRLAGGTRPPTVTRTTACATCSGAPYELDSYEERNYCDGLALPLSARGRELPTARGVGATRRRDGHG